MVTAVGTRARPPASLYVGTLRHRRFTPVSHEFSYPLFMVLLDVDRIPEAMRSSPFTSYNRWNWASFHDADHFGHRSEPLRTRLAADAARAGRRLPSGRILLLTHLRYLGYCFNPVSFYYCYDRDDTLTLMLAEVNNTFGGSHNYWLDPSSSASGASHVTAPRPFRSTSRKSLYVSPFMDADLSYAFTCTPPGPHLVAHMAVAPEAAVASRSFDATLTLDERPWHASQIWRTLARYPWMTASVVAGIHWEALRLWWKGVALVPRPTANGEYEPQRAARSGVGPSASPARSMDKRC